jgi:uncharacterized protein with HEPN domain
MSANDDQVRLQHMLDAARKTQTFLVGVSRKDFDQNEMLQLALIRLVEIIGEAASRITDDYKQQHPQLPWGPMAGMRNRLIHAYFDINDEVLWETLTDSIPALIPQLENLLGEQE